MRPASLLLGAVLAVMAYSTASAGIGETYEQCVARYGVPDSGPEANKYLTDAKDYFFVKSGRTLLVTFYKGMAVDLFIYRNDRRSFSDSEIRQMLEQNKSAEWSEADLLLEGETWKSADGDRQAFLVNNSEGAPRAAFGVFTSEWQKITARNKAPSSDPLKRALDGAETAIRGVRDLLGY